MPNDKGPLILGATVLGAFGFLRLWGRKKPGHLQITDITVSPSVITLDESVDIEVTAYNPGETTITEDVIVEVT